MNRYKITNAETGEVKEMEAEYLGHAIEELGWDPVSCSCEILSGPAPSGKKRGRPRKEVAPANAEVEPLVSPEVVEKGRKAAQTDQDEAAAIERFEKKVEDVIEKIDPHKLSSDPTEAEKSAYEHKQLIESIAIEAEVMFLRMGQLLYEAREGAEWSILHYESYREYIESLSLPMTNSYSWATRLSAIFEYMVKNMGLDERLLAEIGVAKLTRLLPLARKGELTEEIIEAARVLSDLDLRESLGHNVESGDDEKPDMVICSRCGQVFDARKASRP